MIRKIELRRIDENAWIVVAFFSTIIPELVMALEMRRALQIQGLVLAVALCSDPFWRYISIFKVIVTRRTGICFTEKNISLVIKYILFIVFMFLTVSNLYEVGNNGTSDILIKIF